MGMAGWVGGGGRVCGWGWRGGGVGMEGCVGGDGRACGWGWRGGGVEFAQVIKGSQSQREKACKYRFEAMALSRLQRVLVAVHSGMSCAHACAAICCCAAGRSLLRALHGCVQGLGKTLQIISLIATNCPGAPFHEFCLPDDEDEAGGVRGAGDKRKNGAGKEDKAAKKAKAKVGNCDGGRWVAERCSFRDMRGDARSEAVTHACSTWRDVLFLAAPLLSHCSPHVYEVKRLVSSFACLQSAEHLTEAAQLARAAEAPPTPPSADGPRATLIVCPLSVLSNWQMQLEEHTAGNLSVHVCE